MQFGGVTDFSGQMLTFDGHWHAGEVCSSSRSVFFQLYQADGRHRVCRHVGERFADVNVVIRVPHGDGGVMVGAGISYGKLTQFQFIDGNLCTEIP